MELFEAIKKRRSIRRYQPGKISQEELEAIVDAGRLAATGSNRQPWDFIVVTEKERIDQLSISESWMDKAAAVIVVAMDPASRWWVEDGSAATQNMLLAITALGYGGCWVEGDALPHEEKIKTWLEIPSEKRILAVVPVGIIDDVPNPKKKELSRVIHWEKY